MSPSVCECVLNDVLGNGIFYHGILYISFVLKLFVDNIVRKYTFLDGIRVFVCVSF